MFKLKFKKRTIEDTINFIWIGTFFGLCYWILEAVRDVIVFERGHIVERIFTPDPMSFWMRMLVVCVIVLFSANAQSIRKRLDVRRKDRDGAKPVRSIIRIGLGFGALYWFLESLRDAFVFGKGNILQRILVPDPMGFWMRLLAVCIIVLFSIYAQGLINARIRAEEKLEEEREELEKRIYERTIELSKSNELLKKEVEERNRIEVKLRKVNRALMALSESNLALARTTKETNLLNKICDILIKVGGYRFVWVGMAEKKAHNIRLMSKSGSDDDYVQNIKFRWDKANKDGNPIGKTIVSGKPTIVNYITESTTTNPWYQEAVRRGYQVSISLPLKYNDQTFGAMNIYSDDQHAFDAEEVKLMEELASGLAFGLTALKTKVAHKQAEEDKVNIQAQLNQAQKIEAIGVLTGGIAHDFNNILTAIRITADIAMMEIDGDSPLKKDLKEIYELTERAAMLISQLLLFSRKHRMEYKNVIINTLVQDLQRMLKHLIGEDIQIHTDLEPNLWTTRADRGTIDQVVMNLVVNARDAMPDGGEISIKTANIELDESQCQHMAEAREGKFVCLSVEDTGVGIDENILPDIFDPFFSTKDPGKGTGLGLSVVYGIIKQHDGWMNVSSKIGEGSIFYIYFPCVGGQAVNEKEKKNIVTNEKGNGKRILYIEDEEKVRTYTAKALRRGGYEIFEAATAEEAMNEFDREDGEFHLIVSDVVLPGQSGVDLVEQIRVKKPELPVLLCSGYTDHKANWETIKAKGFPFLQKPYSVSDILQIIQELAA